jgi:hypothetical protein
VPVPAEGGYGGAGCGVLTPVAQRSDGIPLHVDQRMDGTIEAVHRIRDTTYAEDAARIRSGHTPRIVASLHLLAISLLRPTGSESIAQATRYMNAHRTDAIKIIGLTS